MRSPKKLRGMQTSIDTLSARIAQLSVAIDSERHRALPDREVLKTLYSQRVAMLVRRMDICISNPPQVHVTRNAQTP